MGSDERAAREVIALYDSPAYIRRARQVHAAYDELIYRCQTQRQEWLELVRLRVGLIKALAGTWESLRPLLAGESDVVELRRLHDSLSPQLRAPVVATTSQREIRQALEELGESLDRFNRRWAEFLKNVDLTAVNNLREGFNLYYVLEKECAVGSATTARRGFQKLDPLTHEDLARLFPPLCVPQFS
jgi:hypothetical protein